jgi:hypothetical protein
VQSLGYAILQLALIEALAVVLLHPKTSIHDPVIVVSCKKKVKFWKDVCENQAYHESLFCINTNKWKMIFFVGLMPYDMKLMRECKLQKWVFVRVSII